MSVHHLNAISNRLSLRAPQRESLAILAWICEILSLEKDGDDHAALLHKLAGQVVARLQSYVPDEKFVINVLQYH